jgi:hypothetical protein
MDFFAVFDIYLGHFMVIALFSYITLWESLRAKIGRVNSRTRMFHPTTLFVLSNSVIWRSRLCQSIGFMNDIKVILKVIFQFQLIISPNKSSQFDSDLALTNQLFTNDAFSHYLKQNGSSNRFVLRELTMRQQNHRKLSWPGITRYYKVPANLSCFEKLVVFIYDYPF